MKKLVLILSALLFLIGTTDVQAQWGKKLLKKAGESAKRATERNVEKKIDKAVDKTFDSAEDAVTGKGNDSKSEKNTNTSPQGNVETTDNNNEAIAEETPQDHSPEMAYAKSDFVPGDEIIFEDNLAGEQLGEFPSQWDLLSGNAEVVKIDGVNCINFVEAYTDICPLMKDMKKYLPDVFTIELDYYVNDRYEDRKENKVAQIFWLHFYDEKNNHVGEVEFGWSNTDWSYMAPGATSWRNGDAKVTYKPHSWNRLSVSFNKRAFKLYINGVRMANVPNMVAPVRIMIENRHSDRTPTHRDLITNIRIAKGAVPLYDRMMSDGKFITYGITFDVGKSTIKPESMGEINRIVTLMKENPDLKFSVEGHTDSTGNEASNQTLSEARSKAIVDKLIELGIATDRLTASGKGQSSPIADNGTDEGRAKNRRVEFVKL
ncbi:OmpA family protein [Parabacteroides goldsteinii]|jgi:OOP family OmpA-OmpF porin|uniref:OmpA family protein n=1 Tax=Parabacteroides goldsteinii TaxID=328812 RepID=UPI003AB63A9B